MMVPVEKGSIGGKERKWRGRRNERMVNRGLEGGFRWEHKEPTLVSACSVLSEVLRYAWLMSLRGRGMYCKVKLLGENTSEVRERQGV